jgi:hypothetical protein
VRDGRVIVTNNVTDFESLGPVPGLVYACDVTFPRTRAYLSRLVTALAAAAADRETAACGGVLWLRPPS